MICLVVVGRSSINANKLHVLRAGFTYLVGLIHSALRIASTLFAHFARISDFFLFSECHLVSKTNKCTEGTLIDLLMKRFPEVDGRGKQFGFSVSHTTRDPRPGEVDGVAYNFTTVDAIKKEIGAGKFLEYAEVQ